MPSAATGREERSKLMDRAHGTQRGCHAPVATETHAASRRACVLGVPVARLLPVLLLLCECSLTAETALDVGVVDGPHRGACRACPRSSAFVALSSAGGRLEDLSGASCPRRGFVPTTALVVGSTHLLRGLVDRAWRGGVSRSLLAAHAGGFGSRSQTARKCSKTATVKAPVWSKSLQEVLGDASHYSAQERRMLGALSKFGRLHGRAAPADTPNGKAAGVNGQTVREQKEEMAKERRDEKLSLRRRQGSSRLAEEEAIRTAAGFGDSKCDKKVNSNSADSAGMSKEQKLLSKRRLDAKTHSVSHTETLITTGHENGITQGGGPKEKRVVALNSPESHSNYKHLPDSPELKEGAGKEVLVSPRVKHAAVMRHGELRKGEITQTTAHAKRDKRELSLAYKKELPIPHNLANYDSLVALLDVLEPFCESISEYGRGCKPQGGCCLGYTLTPSSVSDAVGALNRLKRLRTQATNKHLDTRLSSCIECLCAVVLNGMPSLSGKLVSLAINAVAHTRRHSRLITAAGKRAIEIAQSDDVHALDVQAVSVILNGFARAGLRDVGLFTHMSAIAIRLMETNSSDFGAQAISVIANAFAKVRITDEGLFTRLARCSEKVPPSDFTPQAIANIMNAYARHDVLDVGLFKFLSGVARRSQPSQWMSRHLALVVNALAKLDHRDQQLLDWIADAAVSRPTSSFDVQAIANILNGYGKLYGNSMDRQLLGHMATALGDMPPRALDPQSVASALNALVKAGYQNDDRDLVKRLAHVALHLDPLLFDAQSVSTIMHSMAKLDMRDDELFKRMAMVVGQMEFILEPQSIALIINACAKIEYHDEKLLKHLSRIACSLPADTFTPQHVENILNGFARLDMRDRTLFLHMAQVVRMLPVQDFDSQAVAIIMNSFARVMGQDAVTARVFHYFSHEVLPVIATVDLQATSLSIILNAFAKAEIRDDETIARLCSVIVSQDALLLLGGTGGIPVSQFDGRHIASVLHAVATLHVEHGVMLDDLLNQLMTLDPEEQLPEEVAIIAWSVAVLNLKRLDVYAWLMRGLDTHIANLDPNFRRQAHQFLLTCELDGFPNDFESIDINWRPTGEVGALRPKTHKHIYQAAEKQYKALKCKAEEVEVHLDYAASQHRPSRLQKDVAQILAEMNIRFVEEYVDQRSGYSLDLLLSDKRTAIEVDGPSHYAAGTHRPLGNTNMKHRHLSQLGFDLRILPYWEWDELKNKEQKKAYLRQLLTAIPSVSV